MIDQRIKDKVKLYMNVQDFCCDKRMGTDEDWDRYFINNYSGNTLIQFYEQDFISYEVTWNCIMIKDFVSECGNGLKLFMHIIKKSKELHKPIMAFIHKSNTRLLSVVERRFGFVKVNTIGNQYLYFREEQ